MNYIKVFTDFAKAIAPLGDAECGRLFRSMLEYAETGAEPELGGNERFLWPVAKLNIDRDIEAYERLCERNKKNRAALSGTDVTSRHQSSPVVTSGDQSSRHVQDKDKDKDKDYSIPPTPLKGGWGEVSDALLSALKDFEKMRAKLKRPMTDRAKKLLLGNLRRLSSDEAVQVQILEQSILHGWQDVYALKGRDEQAAKDKAAASFDIDEIERIVAAGETIK